jgi:hypothetical protein
MSTHGAVVIRLDGRKELRALASMVLDFCSEPPDPNCSCHVAPPCFDCVEHSGMRDLFAAARAALDLVNGCSE